MPAEQFAQTFAPLCFGLLSDKIRDRAASIQKIRTLLPAACSEGSIDAQDCQKLVWAFLDWAEYEFRLCKKDSASIERMQSCLKDTKWLLSLLSKFLGALPEPTICRMIQLMTRTLAFNSSVLLGDTLAILNTCIFGKSVLVAQIRRINFVDLSDLLCVILERGTALMMSQSGFVLHDLVKLVCLVGICIPFNTPFDSQLYAFVFQSLICFLEKQDLAKIDANSLTLVFATLNSLFMSNFDLIELYHARFDYIAVCCFRTRNSNLLQKLVFFLLLRPTTHRLELEAKLLEELVEPWVLSLHAGHPVKFIVDFKRFDCGDTCEMSGPDILRFSFVKLCCQTIETATTLPPALAMLEPFQSHLDLTVSLVDPSKSKMFREWITVAEFCRSKQKALGILEAENPLTSWFKIANCTNMDFELVDDFVVRFFRATSPSALDSFIVEQLYKYWSARFEHLWWSKSADIQMSMFVDWILRVLTEHPHCWSHFTNQRWLISFLQPLLSFSFGNLSQNLTDNQQFAKDLLKYLNAEEEPSPTILPQELTTCILSMLGRLEDSCEDLNHKFICKFVKSFNDLGLCLPLLESADPSLLQLFAAQSLSQPDALVQMQVTDVLTHLIPLINNLSDKLLSTREKENHNSADDFGNFDWGRDDVAASSIYNSRIQKRPLNDTELALLSFFHLCYRLIYLFNVRYSDPESVLIIEDWKTFMRQTLESEAMTPVREELKSTDPHYGIKPVKLFLAGAIQLTGVKSWTPFGKMLAKQNLKRTQILALLDTWIVKGQRALCDFPLIELISNSSDMSPDLFARLFLQESLENITSVLGHQNCTNFASTHFDRLYADLALDSTGDNAEKLGNALHNLLGPDIVENLLKQNALKIVAQIFLLGTPNWPNVVGALKFMSSKLKLSASADLQELLNPIHATIIIPIIAKDAKNILPVVKIFQMAPSLRHCPQLLHLVYSQLERQELKSEFAKYADTLHKDWNLNSLIPHSSCLLNFLIKYCDYAVWNCGSPAAVKLLYYVLNCCNKSGKRITNIENIATLDDDLKKRLKMFVVPAGSKILLQPPTASSLAPTSISAFADAVSVLLHCQNSLPEGNFLCHCAELAACDLVFAQKLFTLVLGNPAFDTVQKSFYAQMRLFTLPPNVWVDLIEALPCGLDKVSRLLQLLGLEANLLTDLVHYCKISGKAETAMYVYQICLELPPSIRPKVDLDLLLSLYTEIDSFGDYVEVTQRRMQSFDHISPEFWDPNVKQESLNESMKLLSDSIYVKWDVPSSLNSSERLFAKWLIDLKQGDTIDFSVVCPEIEPYCNLLIAVKKSSTPTFELMGVLHRKLQEPLAANFDFCSLLPHLSGSFSSFAKYLQADISSRAIWQHDPELAIDIAKKSLFNLPANFPPELHALHLCRIGEWASQCKSERPSTILSSYLDKAMQIVEAKPESFSSSSLAQVFLTVGRFVDQQYGLLIKSDDLKRLAQSVSETRTALDACNVNLARTSSSATSERKALERSTAELSLQYQNDQEEYSRRLKDRNSFLLKSLRYYLAALHYGFTSRTEAISTIFRVCSLWFEHGEEATVNEIINSCLPGQKSRLSVSSGIKTVPIESFLPLIYQLAARASYSPNQPGSKDFQNVLLRLLVLLLSKNPFECIYQLLALRSGSGNSSSSSQTKRRKLIDTVSASCDSDSESRSAAAALVIDQVRKSDPKLASIISSVEFICEAYIEFAKVSFSESECKSFLRGTSEFPALLRIKKLLHPLPPASPLLEIPIATHSSDQLEYFNGFLDSFRLFKGINLPKQVTAISNSGRAHLQLVKGNDDVRQDAVMEQVFQRCNQLLQSSQETRNRNLSMRTYRVIPLQPLVGLIEFVSDSVTMSEYLRDAHERIRPTDLKPDECREMLEKEASRKSSNVESKLEVLTKQISPRFKPVLRHFFYEHFSTAEWWSAKQAYVRSLATSSILGWIVGLGDRHGMNILLDKRSGEVIHIDLNMIFEAGKTLRIPERVPFRLTPDCVDALGPDELGLYGPFKKHAVEVLKLLRKERNTLMLVLEVFKYDPLQKWTGMAAAAGKTSISEQNTPSSNNEFVTKSAERALQRIRDKLEGREEGSILSESGHVSYLIQTAMDPERLCQMFHGWQPYF